MADQDFKKLANVIMLGNRLLEQIDGLSGAMRPDGADALARDLEQFVNTATALSHSAAIQQQVNEHKSGKLA